MSEHDSQDQNSSENQINPDLDEMALGMSGFDSDSIDSDSESDPVNDEDKQITPEKPDFAMILASSVHDMKNSLSMLLNSLEEIRTELPDEMKNSRKVSILQYEAERVNNDLVQLLGIYRLGVDSMSIHIDEYFVGDFLEEQKVRYAPLLEDRGIGLDLDVDPALLGYFDRDLVSGILNNIFANAVRYTRDRISLKGWEQDGFVVIELADNGNGYPQNMCEAPGTIQKGIDFHTSSTSLGLYFARHVAALHKQRNEQGRIELTNGGELGGGIFRIYLP